MPIFDIFSGKKNKTANVAKERLQIIVAQQRSGRGTPDYLPQLERELLEVIRKYIHVESNDVSVHLEKNDDDLSVLELNVTLPDNND